MKMNQFSIETSSLGVHIYFSGYNHKLYTFADSILKRVVTIEKHINAMQFDRIKDNLVRRYAYANYIPLEQANYNLDLVKKEKKEILFIC